MKKDVVLGIDIGGTKTKFGLVDSNGKICFKDSIDTMAESGAADLFNRVFSRVEQLMGENDYRCKLNGIGIGAPNGNYYRGTIERPINLGWPTIDLNKLVRKFYKVPFRVTNDANAAALGEMRFGAAKGMKNFIEITLGTGLGSGIVIDGEMLYGQYGNAGELGHIIAVPDGRKCNCGRRGCLETYASAEGIRRTVFELMSDSNEDSKLRSIAFEKLTSKKIYEFAILGDQIAVNAFEFTAKILGQAFANTASIIGPEAFILFGGLAEANDLLIKPTLKYMNKNILSFHKNKIKILPSGLPSGDAAILGSAALIWHELNHHI